MEKNKYPSTSEEVKAKIQAKLRAEARRKKCLKAILWTFLAILVLLAGLTLMQLPAVQSAIRDVPVLGALPEIVDKIPVIGDIDEIIEKIPGVGGDTEEIPTWTPTEHYKKPVLRSEEEIAETGITAEDVLALYDNIAWEFTKLRWSKHFEKDGVDAEGSYSAQFDRFDVCNNYHFDPELTNSDDYPFYGMNQQMGHTNRFSWLSPEEEKTFFDTYTFNFHMSSVYYDQPVDLTILNAGVYKDQFEPVAEIMGSEKFLLTLDYLDNLNTHQYFSMLNYVNTEVYTPFTITRETIENASEEQLYLFYDLAKSIWSICIEQEYPNIPPRSSAETEPS